MSKQVEQKRFIHQYILDCVDSSGYGVETETDITKIVFLLNTFKAEYGWAVQRMGNHKAFAEWLQGLPSCLNIAFMNCDILALATKQGTLPDSPTEKQEDAILEKYWRYMTMRVFELHRKLLGKVKHRTVLCFQGEEHELN